MNSDKAVTAEEKQAWLARNHRMVESNKGRNVKLQEIVDDPHWGRVTVDLW